MFFRAKKPVSHTGKNQSVDPDTLSNSMVGTEHRRRAGVRHRAGQRVDPLQKEACSQIDMGETGDRRTDEKKCQSCPLQPHGGQRMARLRLPATASTPGYKAHSVVLGDCNAVKGLAGQGWAGGRRGAGVGEGAGIDCGLLSQGGGSAFQSIPVGFIGQWQRVTKSRQKNRQLYGVTKFWEEWECSEDIFFIFLCILLGWFGRVTKKKGGTPPPTGHPGGRGSDGTTTLTLPCPPPWRSDI